MGTLTKMDLIESLMSEQGLTKQEARCVVNTVFEQMAEILIEGKDIRLSGFGNFELKDKTPRRGQNPKTGEEVTISARRVVTFRAGQKLRTCIDQCIDEQVIGQ